MHIDQDASRFLTVERGVRATTPVRTICDLAGRYPASRVAQVIKECQHLDLATMIEIERAAASSDGTLRRSVLSEAIWIRRSGGLGSESDFEDRVREVVACYPIPQPVPNVVYTLTDGRQVRVDLDFQGLDVIGECDGTHTHRTAEQQAEDVRREHGLAQLSKFVVRIAEEDFKADPHAAVQPLVQAVMAAQIRVARERNSTSNRGS